MDDISPELLNKIQKYFAEDVAAIQEEIKSGRMSYEEAYGASIRVGTALSKAFNENISAEILPDGRMYYNIANKVVLPMLKEEHDIVSQAAVQAQQNANKAAGLGIRAQAAEFDTDRAKGIIDRVSSEPYDDIKWILNEPVKTFAKNVVDRTLQKNVEFQGKSGLHPKIVRRASAGACEWCLAVAGTYSYPDVPHDVFRRHENCDCVTEYIDGGKYQDVWTKKSETQSERANRILNSIEAEKKASRENSNRVDVKYINSKEYKDKFIGLTDNYEADQKLYKKAVDILLHRNGTEYEDLHLMLSTNGTVIGSQTHSKIKLEVTANESIKQAVKKYGESGDIIGVHNHPNNAPPSGGDFSSAIERNYKSGVVACHNGDLYVYTTGDKRITSKIYDLTVEKYEKMGYSNYEAYNEALKQLKETFKIDWRKL